MRRFKYAQVVLWGAVMGSAAEGQVQYSNFSNSAGLQLNGGAGVNVNPVDGSVLRVTTNDTGQAGSAFTTSAYNVAGGFSTFFTFRLSGFDNNGFYGADGMMFVVQDDARGAGALGVSGGVLGYGDPDNTPGVSIQNSAGIEFDTFGNGEKNDPDSNHVALDLNGSVVHSTNAGDATYPVEAPGDLKDEGLWYTWVDYNGSTIELRMSQDGVRPAAATLTAAMTLDSSKTYFAGFTAATGSGSENHDVVNWSFSSSYNPFGSVANVLAEAHADGNFLAGAAGGDWSETTSWVEHQVPTGGTNTYLDTFGSAYTLNVGAGTKAVAQNVTIHGSDAGPVTLAIHHGGTLNVAADLEAGVDGASGATISVDGAGSELNVVGSVVLSSGSSAGEGSESRILVSNGGVLSSLDAHVSGDSGGMASVSVDGAGSQWTMREYLYVGENGASGSLSFTQGALVNDKEAHIGSTGFGSVMVDDSTWHTDDTLYVGEYGSASMVTAQNGSVVEAYDVRISHDAGSTQTPSTVTVDGADSHLNVADEILVGGEHGYGLLTISNGAAASSTNLFVGGDLPETDEAAATDDANSTGEVVIDGGSLDNSSGATVVGRNGTGKLTVTNGGQVVSGAGTIGDNLTGNGTACVKGLAVGVTSSWQINGDLVVGRAGTGSLTVKADQGTAWVTASTGTVGWSDGDAVGNGTLTISGASASLTIYGDDAQLMIGREAGNGTVAISNGGSLVVAPTSVSATGGIITVGDGAAGIGTLTVDGAGSQLITSAQINAGYSGTGTVTVSNGGLLITAKNLSETNSSGVLGQNANATGTATVSDPGSKWTQDGTLEVGFNGTGNLMVMNGGELDSQDAELARNPGSNGTATVKGLGSKWVVSDILSVGGTSSDAGGAGQVVISDGGYVLVNYQTYVWAGASIKLQNGGILQGYQGIVGGSLQITDGAAVGMYSITGNGSIEISPGASLVAANVRIGSLTADGGGLYLEFNTGDPYPSRIGSLSISGGGLIDLDNNALILDYSGASVIGNVRGYLQSGALKSTSAMNDAQHRTGLAYAEASKLLGTGGGTWDGQLVDGTTLLVKYTWLGDANMDGKINADDFALIDRGFAKHLAAGAAYWMDGDFNYDGVVTSADYLLIDRGFALQSGTLSLAFLAEREAEFGEGYVSALLASVPEPSVVGALVGAMMMGRRRK